MNIELFDKFVEAVKAGNVEGLFYAKDRDAQAIAEYLGWGQGAYSLALKYNMAFDGQDGKWGVDDDRLAAIIRRWLTSKGFRWTLHDSQLEFYEDTCGETIKAFDDGSELDQHIAAVLFALKALALQEDAS